MNKVLNISLKSCGIIVAIIYSALYIGRTYEFGPGEYFAQLIIVGVLLAIVVVNALYILKDDLKDLNKVING